METKEVVTGLYALRAGLSLIARENDSLSAEVAAAEMSKEAKLSRAQKIRNEKIKSLGEEKLESELETATYNYDRLQENYYNKYEHNTSINWIKNNLENKKLIKNLRIFIGILFIILQLGFAVLSCIHIYIYNMSGFIFIPIIIVLIAIGFTVIFIWDSWVLEDWAQLGVCFAYFVNVVPYVVLMIRAFISGTWLSTVLLICTVVATIPATIITLCSVITNKKDDEHEIKKLNDTINNQPNLINEVWDAGEKKKALERQLEKCKINIENIEKEYESQCEEIDREHFKFCSSLKEPHVETALKIWNILVKTYGDLLDVRDWHILDLILWQLETGRAETIKEALQLADRETQTNRIVQAVTYASKEIMQKIQIGFGGLQAKLDENLQNLALSFTETARGLSREIAKNTETVTSFGERQANSMLATDKKIERIVSQSSLQSALLEKANVSSESLITTVNELKKKIN